MSENMTPLSLASDDDILEEVMLRFDHCIFAGIKDKQKGGSRRYVNRWIGHCITCAGLAYHIAKVVDENFSENLMLDDDDDAST